MTREAAILATILCLSAIPSLAQSPDSSQSAKPATPDANASASSTEKKKPKKVWTNDEISKVSGGVSVVGDAKSSARADSKTTSDGRSPNDEARQRQISEYRKQLGQIQAQIVAIDKRIGQLKNFKGENASPSGGIHLNQGYNMVPLEDQVKQLEDKKKQLHAKMDEVESEAHKNGISSDDLR